MRPAPNVVATVALGVLANPAVAASGKILSVARASCQIPAGKSVTCSVRYPKVPKRYRLHYNYDESYTLGAVTNRKPAPDLKLVDDDTSFSRTRFSVKLRNANLAGTAPALVRVKVVLRST